LSWHQKCLKKKRKRQSTLGVWGKEKLKPCRGAEKQKKRQSEQQKQKGKEDEEERWTTSLKVASRGHKRQSGGGGTNKGSEDKSF